MEQKIESAQIAASLVITTLLLVGPQEATVMLFAFIITRGVLIVSKVDDG